jgi:hypothetical protein
MPRMPTPKALASKHAGRFGSSRAKRMKRFGLCLLFAAAIQSWCSADVTKLPAEDRKAVLDASRFQEVHTTTGLPSAILALCDGGSDGKLAEPGQKWNATDAITDPTLPGKRLIWAAVGGEYTSSITSAAESRIRFTFWLRNWRTTAANRK